jgi:hypothetical protein
MYGKIHSVDPVNPMKTLVYYKDFNTVLFLDNFMNQVREPVRLQDLGLERVSAVCSSYNNGLWVYDSGSNELVRLDAQYSIAFKTGRLQQSTGFIPEPQKMIERNDRLYISDTAHGVIMYDVYGAYLGLLPFKGLKDFNVVNDNLLFVRNDSLHSFNQKLLSDTAFAMPEKGIISVRNIDDRLMIRSKEQLNLYLRKP